MAGKVILIPLDGMFCPDVGDFTTQQECGVFAKSAVVLADLGLWSDLSLATKGVVVCHAP